MKNQTTEMLRHCFRQLGPMAAFVALWWCTSPVSAEIETISGQTVGSDTRLEFSHATVPGATGIDFSFFGGVSPMYPSTETHVLVTDFEWRSSPADPWTVHSGGANSIPGGITSFISTGVYHGPVDAPFVAIHFYAGGFMIVSGTFTHTSVPEPSSLVLLVLGGLTLWPLAWRKKRQGLVQ